MSGAEFLEAMLDSGARPFECQDCGVVHWLSEKDRLAIEAAAPDPENARLWAERNHYLAGCVCPASPWCAPHGWAGTVEPDDHSICADHPHVDPEGRADIPDALKRLEPAPDPVASPSEAVRLLRAVLDQFDYWSSDPRPAVDGGTVRLHKFGEVQPEMERVLDEARRYLAATEEGTP